VTGSVTLTDDLQRFVRGLHYDRTGRLLPVGTKFEAVEPPHEVMQQAGQGLPGDELTRGLAYRYSESENGDGRAVWFFYIWEQVQMGVLVEPPGTLPIIT